MCIGCFVIDNLNEIPKQGLYVFCVNQIYELTVLFSMYWGSFLILQTTYCQISNISHTKFQNLNVSRHVLRLSLCNILKPGVK